MTVRSGSPPPRGPGAIAVGEIVCGSASGSNGVTCSVAASFAARVEDSLAVGLDQERVGVVGAVIDEDEARSRGRTVTLRGQLPG